MSPTSSQKYLGNDNTQLFSSHISGGGRQRTPHNRSNSKEKSRERSNSATKSRMTNKSQSYANKANYGGLLASPYSPESVMTRNPVQLECFSNQAQGIDDT